MHELIKKYQQEKEAFLDNLQPDDFRNGGSFNQAEDIIEKVNQSVYLAALAKKDPEESILKAVTNLFRENSPARDKAVKLSKSYIEMKLANNTQ